MTERVAVPLGKVASPQAMTEGVPAPPRECFRRKPARQLSFPFTTSPVKMRLERSAERDKREISNNYSADYAQSKAERIPNRDLESRQYL